MKKILIVLPFVILFLFSCASSPDKGTTDGSSALQEPTDMRTAKNRAVDAMNKAKSIKADIAVKDDYNSALAVFNEAEKEAQAATNELATTNKYLEAERLFLAAYENARAKREEATKQLNKAKEDIHQVESDAEAFDKEQSEGTTQGGPAR